MLFIISPLYTQMFTNSSESVGTVGTLINMEKEKNTMRKLDISKRYRHFKGFEVTILAVGTHTETGETMVIYSCDSFDGKSHKKDENGIYIRPLDMFLSEVDHEKYPEAKQKYRFEEID